jgi:hypothetical protein
MSRVGVRPPANVPRFSTSSDTGVVQMSRYSAPNRKRWKPLFL